MRALRLLCFLSLFYSCNTSQKVDDFDREKVIEEIELMLTNYHTAVNKEGLTAEFEYLDKSSDFFWVPPGYETALTYDSVRTILIQNDKSIEAVDLSWKSLQIFPQSNSIANYTGIVNSKTIDTAEVKAEIYIIESGTIIKRADGWKLLSGQSAVLNPH